MQFPGNCRIGISGIQTISTCRHRRMKPSLKILSGQIASAYYKRQPFPVLRNFAGNNPLRGCLARPLRAQSVHSPTRPHSEGWTMSGIHGSGGGATRGEAHPICVHGGRSLDIVEIRDLASSVLQSSPSVQLVREDSKRCWICQGRLCGLQVTARVITTPAQADTAVRTVPQVRSTATIRQCQPSSVA